MYCAPQFKRTTERIAVVPNFFNLSPRNTDGKYPGKAVGHMLHMVFKVAKVMAPSVIYIDEVEKVFVSDKKKMKRTNSERAGDGWKSRDGGVELA